MTGLGGVPDLSLVIPVHNEGENPVQLVREVSAALSTEPRVRYEIVLVDDGSTDGTSAHLRALRREVGNLRVITHSRQRGQSAAIRTGAARARAAWVATLDGDGQNDPADVLRLWQVARHEAGGDGSVLVLGSRVVRRDPLRKRWLSWWLNLLSSVVLRHRRVDRGCGLKVFRRDDLLSLPAFDHMHRFLPPLFAARGIRTVPVAVNHRPRPAGRSHYGTLGRAAETIIDILGVAWLVWRDLPPDGGTESGVSRRPDVAIGRGETG